MTKKGPLQGARHGNTERQRIHYAARIAAERAKKKNPSWYDFKRVRFTESHSSRLHGTKLSAQNSWVLEVNSQGRNGPMKQREDYAEAMKIKERLYEESGGARPQIPPSKQVCQRTKQPFSRASKRAECILPLPHQAHLRHGGNHQINGGRHRVGMNSELFIFKNTNCKMFHLQAMAVPLEATGGVNSTPNLRTFRTSAHVNFLAWLKTYVIKSAVSVCLSTKQPSSHLARHVTRSIVVVPSVDLFCTFHSHSPT